MRISGLVWLHSVVNKLDQKHHVSTTEVEEVFQNRPRFRRVARGNVAGEDLYLAMGQTDAGRYLVALFIHSRNREALIVTARDMTAKERRQYGKA